MKKWLVCIFSFLFLIAYSFTALLSSIVAVRAEDTPKDLGTLSVQRTTNSDYLSKGVPFMLGPLTEYLEGTCVLEQGEISVQLTNGTTKSFSSGVQLDMYLILNKEDGFQPVYFKFSQLDIKGHVMEAGDTFVIGRTFVSGNTRFTLPKFRLVFGETHEKDSLELVRESSFSMLKGALLRMDGEHNGLRFQAEIGEACVEGATYFMLIVPEAYITHFEITGNYYEELQEVLGDRYLANMEATPFQATQVDEEESSGRLQEGLWYLQGSITDIRYENLNEKFFAVAYYVDSEGAHYAEVEFGRNVQSIGFAAKKAVEDTKANYTAEELEILQAWVDAAAAQAAGKSEEEYEAEKSA